jgi:hypothetical protein
MLALIELFKYLNGCFSRPYGFKKLILEYFIFLKRKKNRKRKTQIFFCYFNKIYSFLITFSLPALYDDVYLVFIIYNLYYLLCISCLNEENKIQIFEIKFSLKHQNV